MKHVLLSLLGFGVACAASAVTFNVTVPAGTKQCYIAGAFNNWNASDPAEMQKDGDNHFTLTLADVTTAQVAEGFKYLCGPDWNYVEKDAQGEEIANRTVATANDVVASWRNFYNASIKTVKMTINGYERNIRIYVPDNYADTAEDYPVLYYLGVQQRYSQGGGDNPGDDLFGVDSWNAATVADEYLASHGKGCIMVSVAPFVAECIPYAHPDFMGSGASDAFLADYIAKVPAYIEANYRVAKGPENTTVLGADLGGVLSLYAALNYPEVIGNCVSMSPMLWLNRDQMKRLGSLATSAQKYVLAYGSAETAMIQNDVKAFVESMPNPADCIELTGAIHNDVSWGAALPALFPLFVGDSFIAPTSITVASELRSVAPKMASFANISDAHLKFYYTESGSNPVADSSVAFSLVDNYVLSNGQTETVQVLVKKVSSSFQGTCYWNVYDTDAGSFLSADNFKCSFSNKKTAESWIRVVVRADGSIDKIDASSIGFVTYAGDGKVTMAKGSDFHATATVPFTGKDKTFTVHYGSVNSQSDMGAITGTLSVSDECLEAMIDYDFMLNSVRITETKWGEQFSDIVVEEFSAVPAVTYVGETARVTLKLQTDCTPQIMLAHNYGTASSVTLVADGNRTWHADIANLKSGIYSLKLSATKGSNKKDNIADIWIKVISDSPAMNSPRVTTNAYDGVDWETTNRYKANFHTHTSQSFDTQYAVHEVVDLYHEAGYEILALTDHDYNPYPWTLFDLFNPQAESRDPDALGMLTIPSIELSKDNTNSWSETVATGEFNHHNDFFTGRKGQEFATLRESYAYTEALGGMQIINHPGQYWNLGTEYAAGAKNSADWHAENFNMFSSLVGLEVYNQGNRRPNDRILWDQILTKTMPDRPVWGYSCDDTHTREQYFRNYQFMLMPDLTVDALKEAMKGGREYFSYEYTGSGEAKAPRISSITVDNVNRIITVDTDTPDVKWICGTDKSGGASTRKSTVVGIGKSFDFSGFQGNYVRALLTNEYGETCTQPFGFSDAGATSIASVDSADAFVDITYNSLSASVTAQSSERINSLTVYSVTGSLLIDVKGNSGSVSANVSALAPGIYIAVADTDATKVSRTLMIK